MVITMKKISLKDYKPSMGVLIDVRHPDDYMSNPTQYSINIYIDRLLMNHNKLLNKNNKYYIICNKGQLSKKAVATLEYFGYDITQVIN